MKKFMMLIMVLTLGVVLVACGDNTNTPKEPSNTVEEGNDNGSGDFVSGEVDNEYFKKVIAKLKEKGFEVEPKGFEQDPLFVDVKENQHIEINKEDFMPLEVYEIEEDSEHLKEAEETGEFAAEFEGQKGMLPVHIYGKYIFYLAEGHPDFDAIFEAIDEIE